MLRTGPELIFWVHWQRVWERPRWVWSELLRSNNALSSLRGTWNFTIVRYQENNFILCVFFLSIQALRRNFHKTFSGRRLTVCDGIITVSTWTQEKPLPAQRVEPQTVTRAEKEWFTGDGSPPSTGNHLQDKGKSVADKWNAFWFLGQQSRFIAKSTC